MRERFSDSRGIENAQAGHLGQKIVRQAGPFHRRFTLRELDWPELRPMREPYRPRNHRRDARATKGISQPMPGKLVVRNLIKHYGDLEAVRGVSFDVADGEIFGLLGPNGAGKTTTVECIIGLRRPDGGSIELCGIDALNYPAAVKERIGVALQSTSLQDKITPREALTLFGSFYSKRVDIESRSPQAYSLIFVGGKSRCHIRFPLRRTAAAAGVGAGVCE